MSAKCVIIGAGRDSIHTINKAKSLGACVVALDGDENAEGLKYADEGIVVDIKDNEEVCNVIKKVKPDFVTTVPIGRYLSTTGYVNEKFGFKGIKYNATLLSVDKYLFHKKLEEKGLRNVTLHLVNKNTKFDTLNIKYPAIMKPRFGSGSRDVFYITNDYEKEQAYDKVVNKDEDFILEEVVEGVEYGMDGAVIEGKLNVTLLRKKVITPLPERQAIASFSVPDIDENKELLDRAFEKVQKVVCELEYDNCLLNADLIVNDEDVFVIEISPRPSGHNLHNVFVPCATGVDIAEEYLKFMMDKDYAFTSEKINMMQIRFFDFSNVKVLKVPEKEELFDSDKCNMRIWNCDITQGEELCKVVNGHSIMGRGFFVIEGKDEEDLVRQSEWVLSQFVYEEI